MKEKDLCSVIYSFFKSAISAFYFLVLFGEGLVVLNANTIRQPKGSEAITALQLRKGGELSDM